MRSLKDVEQYRAQFVDNENKNILILDPVLSSHDYYTMILPALVMNTFEKANIAFNAISQNIESKDRKPIDLAAHEIKWADTIVFPFCDIKYEVEGKSMFEWIKEINPAVKIIVLVEYDYTNVYYSREIAIIPAQQLKVVQVIRENVNYNLNGADLVLTHSDYMLGVVLKELNECGIKTQVYKMPMYNHQDLILEGLDEKLAENQWKTSDFVSVFVDFLDEKSILTFIDRVVDKNGPNVKYFTRSEVNHPQVYTLKKASITHWYKELMNFKWDYYMPVGNSNLFTKSNFLQGRIIDCAFFGIQTLITAESIYKVLDIEIQEICTFVPMRELNKFLMEPTEKEYMDRLDRSNKILEMSDSFNASNVAADKYSEIFL